MTNAAAAVIIAKDRRISPFARLLMKDVLSKFRELPFIETVKLILSSRIFPFFMGAVSLLFYYCGWDIATIYFLGITGSATVLLLDDLTPIIPQFLFLDVIISVNHSPSQMAAESGYYSNPVIYWQAIIVVGVYVAAILARIAFSVKRGTFKPNPVFFGLCAFSLVLVLNGIGSVGYSAFNLMYGIFMAFFFLAIFMLLSGNAQLNEENYKKIGWGFFAFSLVLVIELAVVYITKWNSGLFTAEGAVDKQQIVFGWGIWNTMGMLLVISIPAVMMLASKYEYGFFFLVYASLLALCAVLTMSRQAMVGAVIAYPASLIVCLVKSKARSLNAVAAGGVIAIAAIIVAAKWDLIGTLLGSVKDGMFSPEGELSGNQRIPLIEKALKNFLGNPVFGSGFFAGELGHELNDVDYTGLGFVPEMACNTLAQVLGACGMIGIAIYCVHRIQTIIAFAEKPNFNKLYIAVLISALLIMSLFDNHMFYIFPTMYYSSLLPFATGKGAEGKSVFPVRISENRQKAAV